MLSYYFKHADEPQSDLLDFARKYELADLKEWAWGGLVENMISKGIQPDIKKTLFPMQDSEAEQFNFLLSGLLKWAGDPERPATDLDSCNELMKAAYPDQKAYVKHLKGFLELLQGYQPFEVWNKFGDLMLGNPDSKEFAVKYLTSNMVAANPEKGMGEILKYTKEHPGIIPPERFTGLVTIFLRRNHDAALSWLELNRGVFPSDVSDHVIQAFAEDSISSGNLEDVKKWISEIRDTDLLKQIQPKVATSLINGEDFSRAWDYVNQIANPAIRKQAEGVVWGTQRDHLRADVGKDPSGTIQTIAAGKSSYPDYWLEEAMGTWVAKDFDKAQDWYQQNWKALPASKSQYLAAAFASQAVQQGDTATARQWAALIQDAKTKDRINAGIAKVEAQPKP